MVNRLAQLSEILADGVGSSSRDAERSRSHAHTAATETFQFWHGASGTCYVHSVFELTECPEVPRATYVLVASEDGAAREVLHVGETTSSSMSLNRAHIRQTAARLGANEVHLHFLGADTRERAIIQFDLAQALLGEAAQASQLN